MDPITAPVLSIHMPPSQLERSLVTLIGHEDAQFHWDAKNGHAYCGGEAMDVPYEVEYLMALYPRTPVTVHPLERLGGTALKIEFHVDAAG